MSMDKKKSKKIIKWVKIIAKIIELIAGGLTASAAVSCVSKACGLSEGIVWEKFKKTLAGEIVN